ncbi:MAG TPA: 6-phosphogluconolactonase [Chloroflexota bacterium]|nr:6-phosphogluconolactonase [Chloroflexota bacterium]
MAQPDIRVLASPQHIFAAAADLFVQHVHTNVALSGGSTPKGLFGLLAEPPYRQRMHWTDITFYWGDERCVPPDDPESNYRMANEALLSKIPTGTVHRIHGEDDPHLAAEAYERLLPDGPLDLVLLGMGPDGHTASLFPHTPALQERSRRVTENYVDKLSTWRVSLTAPELQRAHQVLFLVAGADKAAALKQVLQGPENTEEYPSQLLRQATGGVTWLIDAAAAAQLG